MTRVVLALVATIVALSGLVAAKTAEERRLRDDIDARAACGVALTGQDLTASIARCPEPLAAVHRQARQPIVCDQALLAGDLFVMRSSCSTEVKTLFAAREAETRRADALAETLARERGARAAAIQRAEARARSETERKTRADAALQAAPRDDSGRLVLDAGRLRQLAGERAGVAADRP